MKKIILHIRTLIFLFACILAIGIYMYVVINFSSDRLQIIRLTQLYALTALLFLYLTILASPLYVSYTNFPCKALYIRARKALGISAFFFSLLHASVAFFGQLGGFEGISFLSINYLLMMSLGLIALVILFILTITSLNFMIYRLGKYWKPIHRMVYWAGLLIVIHALLLGTHFSDLSGIIPQVFFLALVFLLILEAKRFDEYIFKKFQYIPRIGVASILTLSCLITALIYFYFPIPTENGITFGIHSQHIKIAQQIQQDANNRQNNVPNGLGLDGDRTLRYSVSFDSPPSISPDKSVNLRFKVFNASNGDPIAFFKTSYEKPVHLIVVNNDLTYFQHIHPVQKSLEFSIDMKFPQDDLYRLYLSFQPFGAIEQQFAFTLPVGRDLKITVPSVNNIRKKTVGNYEVSLDNNEKFIADKMSIGLQKLTFSLKDSRTKKPITNLKPYLAAFGHLVMINQEDYSYLHVHPNNLAPLKPGSTGGPMVSFIPLGLQTPIKPGTYRLFAQFNPNNTLIMADFVIKVE